MTINERLRAVLEALGMNTRSFALEAGIDPAVLHNIVSEKGRQSKPSFDLLEKILVSFDNISSEYLMRGTGPIFQIKKGEEGVRYFEEKRGKVMGKVNALLQNDLYIKSQAKDARKVKVQIIEEDIGEISLSEPERPIYSDLRGLIEQQRHLMRAILGRLEALERAQALQHTPHLPGGEKSPV